VKLRNANPPPALPETKTETAAQPEPKPAEDELPLA